MLRGTENGCPTLRTTQNRAHLTYDFVQRVPWMFNGRVRMSKESKMLEFAIEVAMLVQT